MIVGRLFAIGARINGAQLKWVSQVRPLKGKSAASGEENRSPQEGGMKSRLVFCLLSACVLPTLAAAAGGEDYFIYVGSYTDAPSHSKGIYAWRFEPSSGSVTPLGLVAETVNPAYVCATPDGRFLYAVNWQTAEAAKGDVSAPMRSTTRLDR